MNFSIRSIRLYLKQIIQEKARLDQLDGLWNYWVGETGKWAKLDGRLNGWLNWTVDEIPRSV